MVSRENWITVAFVVVALSAAYAVNVLLETASLKIRPSWYHFPYCLLLALVSQDLQRVVDDLSHALSVLDDIK
jgi:hypothetical protein